MKINFRGFIEAIKKKINNIGGARRYRWMKISIYLGVGLLVFGIVYESFFSHDDFGNSVGKTKTQKETENIASIGVAHLRTLNPLVSNDEDTRYLSPLIYRSLFSLDEKMTPQADLADTYSFSGNTMEITLKSAKWEDGEPIKGKDVEFTYRALKKIGNAGPYARSISSIKNIRSDGNKVMVDFNDSSNMSMHYLQFPVLPSHVYSGTDSITKEDEDFQPIGSGPFKCGTFSNDKGMIMYPSENFSGEKAKSNIKVVIIKDDLARSNFVEAGNISVLLSKDADRSGQFTKEGIKIDNFLSNQIEFLAFNTKSTKVDKRRVRRAIAYCTDLDSILEEDYIGSAKKSPTLFMEGYMNSKGKSAYSFDKDKAEALLKKAGYEDKDKDGVLDDENGEPFTLDLIVGEGLSERKGALEKIAKSLKSVGVESNIRELSQDALKAAISSGDYDVALIGMSLDDTMDLRSLLKSEGSNNVASYSAKEVDEYFDKLYSGMTIEQSQKEIDNIKKMINEDMPYYCICYRTYGIVKAPVFSGEIKSNFINPYMKAETWSSVYIKNLNEEQDD